MGSNVEQYEMYDNDNYSNAIGFGCGFILNKDKRAKCEIARASRRIKKSTFSLKSFFGIGDGKIFGKVVSPRKQIYSDTLKKSQEREAIANANKPKDSWIYINGQTEGNNNKLYIGIGIIAIGVIAFSLIKNKK